jgi:hypothetical protein
MRRSWSVDIDFVDTAIKSVILLLLGYLGRLVFRRTPK